MEDLRPRFPTLSFDLFQQLLPSLARVCRACPALRRLLRPDLLRELATEVPRSAANNVKPPATLALAAVFLALQQLHPALVNPDPAQRQEAVAVTQFLARTLVDGGGGAAGRVQQASLAELAATLEVAVRYGLDVPRAFVQAVEARADALVATLVAAAPAQRRGGSRVWGCAGLDRT